MTAMLHAFLDSTELGAATQLGPVTLVPLLLQDAADVLEIAILDEESARVREVSESGVVGRLRVESLTPLPLLLVAGELVQGAKQNRLVNASVLVEPGGEHDISVSCVEQGRWAFGARRGFASAGATAPWRLRSSAALRASRSRRHTGRHDADQSTVWSDIRHHLRQHRVESGTANLLDAMAADRSRHAAALEAIEAWQPGAREVGAVLFVDGSTSGLEAFCAPDAWRVAGRRILRGLCADAATRDAAPSDAPALARALLERIRGMTTSETRGDGLGTELHGEAERTHLTALTVDQGQLAEGSPGGVVHLRVARLDTEPPPQPEPRPDRPPRDPERPAPRRLPGEGSVLDRFEARELQRRRLRIDSGHRAARDLLPDRVAVGGRCLVMPLPTYERALRSGVADGLVPPIPHRCGGGLVLWRARSQRGLERIAAALDALGVPERLCVPFEPQRRMIDLPDWLDARSGPDGTALLCLVDR